MKKSLKETRNQGQAFSEEPHSKSGALFKEFILGGQDGLVNVLGVILGIAVATSQPKLVIIAGLAAAFAESFSMAAVAFTSGRAEQDYYRSEQQRELFEIDHYPLAEKREIYDIYYRKGFRGRLLDDIVRRISGDKKTWLKIMMTEELGLSGEFMPPLRGALIVGSAAMVGSLIPLVTFFFLPIRPAVLSSLGVSAVALFATGAVEARLTIGHWARKGLQLALIGMGAALIGFLVGKWLGTGP
jgi:VIT1/CCC1 family predicted Fe2+/Mn2+ transporter